MFNEGAPPAFPKATTVAFSRGNHDDVGEGSRSTCGSPHTAQIRGIRRPAQLSSVILYLSAYLCYSYTAHFPSLAVSMLQTLLPFVVALQFRPPTQHEQPYVLKGKPCPYPHRPTRFSFRLPPRNALLSERKDSLMASKGVT